MELRMETIGWTPIKLMTLNPNVIQILPEPKALAFSPLSKEHSLSLLGSPVITPLKPWNWILISLQTHHERTLLLLNPGSDLTMRWGYDML